MNKFAQHWLKPTSRQSHDAHTSTLTTTTLTTTTLTTTTLTTTASKRNKNKAANKTNMATNKRAADNEAGSERLKRSKSILPYAAKRSESYSVDVTGKCQETGVRKKLKGTMNMDGTLNLTCNGEEFDGGTEYLTVLVNGECSENVLPEKLKERFELLKCYVKFVTARGEKLQKENDLLKKQLEKANVLKEKIEDVKTIVEQLEKKSNSLEKEKVALKANIKKMKDEHDHNRKISEKKNSALEANIGRMKYKQHHRGKMLEKLENENTQLKAQVKRLNSQEL